MEKSLSCKTTISDKQVDHPCMSKKAHHKIARIHLPVAVNCNIKCNYCERNICPSNINHICPGLAERILTPLEALIKTGEFISNRGENSVVGISGPGEPLANPETIETFQMIRNAYPDIKLCLCTNGLNLPEYIDDIVDLNIHHLSVTISALNLDVIAEIYSYINKNGQKYIGLEMAKILLESQLKGIQLAVKNNINVKINSVFVPGINDEQIIDISRKMADLGCFIHNITPVIPRGNFKHIKKPLSKQIDEFQKEAGQYINVFTSCKQCRADATGIPGIE
jgi:nitrogen fixation protein NifB